MQLNQTSGSLFSNNFDRTARSREQSIPLPLPPAASVAEAGSREERDDGGGGAGVRAHRAGPRPLPLRQRSRQEALPRPYPPLQVSPQASPVSSASSVAFGTLDQAVRCALVESNSLVVEMGGI